MDRNLTIHERYQSDRDALLERYENREIGAYEWARKDRALKGAYLYECLHTGDHGCDDMLARMASTHRLSA